MASHKCLSSEDAGHRIQNYENYLNKVAKRRRPSALAACQKYAVDGYVYMAGGLPNASLFPITHAQLQLRDGRTVQINEDEMEAAQTYGHTIGLPPMVDWLIQLQRRLHNPPALPPPGVSPSANSDMELIITIGGQDGMSKVLESMLEEGDSVLVEKYTFPPIVNIIEPLGCRGIPVQNDADGMVTSDLERILSSWNESISGRRPRLVYCVPAGGNPTGTNWSLERKKGLYALARKYEMLILEDDPYYMLQFSQPLIPSLLSLDEDGRVLRCDSFSKVIAPGSRIGYLSGPRQFLDKVLQYIESTSMMNSGISQMVIWKVLQTMGQDGFIERGRDLARFYHSRSKTLIEMAEKHLKGLAEWSVPDGGMFMWMKLLRVVDSTSVCHKLMQKGAVFVVGHLFLPVPGNSPYVRISYSSASRENMEKAFRWLAEILKEDAKE